MLEFALIGIALGLSLGLFGGGGGILAIPLLVAVGVPTDEAGTTSLVVVGIGAMGGLIPHARAGRIAWKEGVLFSALGAAGAIAGSRLALVTDDRFQLWGFAVVLVVAGVNESRSVSISSAPPRRPSPAFCPVRDSSVSTGEPRRPQSGLPNSGTSGRAGRSCARTRSHVPSATAPQIVRNMYRGIRSPAGNRSLG